MDIKNDCIEINIYKYVREMNDFIYDGVVNTFCHYWRDEIVAIFQKYLNRTTATIECDGYEISLRLGDIEPEDKIVLLKTFIQELKDSPFYEHITDVMPLSIQHDMVEWR